ncbi:PP2C family protein-serine/threonine phosphatase [Aquiflexum lacus]|uniref:PP2C family protein-serine/threonine phosphatase n=1 Tax=Aquiflexum lacus TaxID=2483805 RepID=UPI0018958CDE|nr:PP2C family serine/threonine-protein phosphatase [Aquiflexum lacus]
MKAITVSHKGKRDINQDLILDFKAIDGSYLLAVIDGMGGYDYGEIAARIIRENIEAYLSTVGTIDAFHIQKAINKSNLAIRQQKSYLIKNMGATIGGVIIRGSSVIYFWVGDVKILHFRNKVLFFESSPHNLISDLIASGNVSEPSQLSKYRHVVTRSVQGETKKSHAEILTNDFCDQSDLLIVCSDGVHDTLDCLQIENILRKVESPSDLKAELESRLLEEASDNFSFVIITYS